MHTYFDTAPAAAVKPMFDGNDYVYTNMEMYPMSDGRRHVRLGAKPRMMRVARIENGIAYVELGKAGDAIACTVNLPFSVVSTHTADAPLQAH